MENELITNIGRVKITDKTTLHIARLMLDYVEKKLET